MEKDRSRGAGKEAEISNIGRLIGCSGDAQSEELDALVFGFSNSRENVRVPWVGNTICKQHCYFDAVGAGFFQVNLGHVGDGVRGVGAMPNVDYWGYLGLEILCSSPISEGLLCDNVAAVLQQSNSQTQAASSLQPDTSESVHHVHGKLFFILMIVFCTLRAVQQEGKFQATVFIKDGCDHTEQVI